MMALCCAYDGYFEDFKESKEGLGNGLILIIFGQMFCEI